MAGAGVSLSDYSRLIGSNRNFRRLWLAQIVSETGDWLYTVSIYALLLQLTGSAKSIAIAFVLQVLPQFFVSPMAGVVNDHVSRRRVMIATDLIRAVVVLTMIFATRAESIPFIYLLLFVETVMWAFFEPGRSALMPNVAGRDELVTANSLGSMTWSINLTLGSGLGGIVAAFAGRDAVFVIDCLSFLASAALVWGIRIEEKHLEGVPKLRARDLVNFTPVAEGIRYVSKDRRLISLLFVKAGLGVLAPHWVLLPVFGERIFPLVGHGLDPARGGMLAMSALMASRGIGALLGPLVSSLWVGRSRERLRTGILFGFLLGGAGYFGLSGAPSLALACLAMMVVNAGNSIGWVFSTTLLQQYTEDRFRGRVFSADFAFLVVSMSLANYTAGFSLDHGIGPRAVAMATALVVLLPACAWAFVLRRWPAATPAQQ